MFHVKQGYFITGTGTGVGKTFVTTALARRARDLSHKVLAYKPIETGCRRIGDRLIGEDQQALWKAAGGWQTGALAGLYQFEPPVAPSVAAQRANVELSVQTLIAPLQATPPDVDLILVEGAGGWRVPITRTEDMASLARACGFPVIVAATAVLGTLNHSLLTLEAVQRDGLHCAALVLSCRPEDDRQMVESNVDELRARWDGRIVVLGSDRSVLDPLLV